MIKRVTVEQNVKGLNIAVGSLVGGFGLALWFLLGLIDSRFDRADTKITAVVEQVSDLRVEIVTQTSDIKLLLEKQNGSESEKSAGGEQPNSIREGTSARP